MNDDRCHFVVTAVALLALFTAECASQGLRNVVSEYSYIFFEELAWLPSDGKFSNSNTDNIDALHMPTRRSRVCFIRSTILILIIPNLFLWREPSCLSFDACFVAGNIVSSTSTSRGAAARVLGIMRFLIGCSGFHGFPQQVQSYEIRPFSAATPTSYCYSACGPYPFTLDILTTAPRPWYASSSRLFSLFLPSITVCCGGRGTIRLLTDSRSSLARSLAVRPFVV